MDDHVLTPQWSPVHSPQLLVPSPRVSLHSLHSMPISPAIIDCPRAQEAVAQSPILQAAKPNQPITLPSPKMTSSDINIEDSPSQPRLRACSYIATPEMWSQPAVMPRLDQGALFSMLPPQHMLYNAPTQWSSYGGENGGMMWGSYHDHIPEGDPYELDENNPAYLGVVQPPSGAYSSAEPTERSSYHSGVRPSACTHEGHGSQQDDRGVEQEAHPHTPHYSTRSMIDLPLTPMRPACPPAPSASPVHPHPRSSSSFHHKQQQRDNHGEHHPSPPLQEHQPTTLMFRNIPNKYTREMLLEEIGENGFNGKFDFFYLPIDFRNRCNVGYAFINLISPHEAQSFKHRFQGKQLKAFNSAKVCEITIAKVQGKDANVEQYRNSAVMNMDEKYHPLIFENTKRLLFPEPTVGLKPYRPRAHPVTGGVKQF